jgi:hypothetical protein
MKNRAFFAVAISSLLLGGATLAAGPPELHTLFPHQASIYVEGGQSSRLELPLEVLAACRADLSDLRIFDAEEREVPFLVDSGLPTDTELEVTQTVAAELLAVRQRRSDPETGPSLWEETYELTVPEESSVTELWDLVVTAAQPEFVRRLAVVAFGDDGTETEIIREGSLFRLVDPLRERTRLTLPPLAAGRIVVTLIGEDGGYLEPVFRFENSRSIPPRRRASVELVELDRRQIDRRTIVELRRPRGLVPDVVVMSTSTAVFNRTVEVWDEGPSATDRMLAREELFRLTALTAVEDVDLSLATPSGDRLRVIINDGDSPPLENLSFQAVVRGPALIFSLTSSEDDGPAGMLRFGGGRAFRPQYDLADLAVTRLPVSGETAEVAERLYDPALLGRASLGSIVDNPKFDPSPALAFAMRPGAAIDPRFFSHRRRLWAKPSSEGLSRLTLTPQDLAHGRSDLADLRIVDTDSRQWAYLLEENAVTDTAVLDFSGPISKEGRSTFTFHLPTRPLNLDQIVVHSPIPFFDRSFELTATLDEKSREEIKLATGRLVRRAGDPRPVIITFPPTRAFSLAIEIVDGDDSPLELERISARFPLPQIFFAAPAGDYDLLLGNPEAERPRYELNRVRQVVLAVESLPVDAAELASNPDYRPGARLATQKGALQVLLWVVVTAVVIFLTVLTLRLARQEGDDTD